MALHPEITAAIVAGLCVLATDQLNRIESKDNLRVAVAADISAITDGVLLERTSGPASLFQGNVQPLTSWDRLGPRVGELPGPAVEAVATFYSRLRGLLGVIPTSAPKADEWRQTSLQWVAACGLWAISRLRGGDFSINDYIWMQRIRAIGMPFVSPDPAKDSTICTGAMQP